MAIDKTLEVSGINQRSEEILKEFLSHYSGDGTYVNGIRRLYDWTHKTDFTKLTYNDFILAKNNLPKSILSLVETFFKYLYCNGYLDNDTYFESGECYWKKEKWIAYFSKKKELKNGKKIAAEYITSLTLPQIEKIKSFTKNVLENDEQNFDDIRLSYCFYALFYNGMSVNALRELDAKNYDDGLILTKEDIYVVPEEYQEMFLHFKSRRMSKFSILNMYVDQLGKKVKIDDLIPLNITKSRKQNLWLCTECGHEYLAFAENWQCVNNKFICNECAQKLVDEDVKKKLTLTEVDNIEIDVLSEKEHKKIELNTSSFEQLRSKLKPPCNFDSWHAYLQEIGDLGQKFVIEQEKLKLYEAGLDNLAEQVSEDPASDHTNGYDVLSFTMDKRELHIEVKATPGCCDQPFYISSNERQTAEQAWKSGIIHEIHRVYNVQSGEVGRVIYTSFNNFDFEDIVYKVTIKNRE